MVFSFRRGVLTFTLLATALASEVRAQPAGPLPQPLPLFPADHWWNVDVSQAPLDPGSAAFIAWIGGAQGRRVHPDWGASANDPGDPTATYGVPYVSVPGTQPLVPVTWVAYGHESDNGAPGRPAGYPIPEAAKTTPAYIEGGQPGNIDARGDRHLLLVDRDNRLLYELYRAHWNSGANRWEAESGAVFDLTRNDRRPEGWTSADAAGLAILPGLARYDEVFGTDPIRHALRVTVRATNGYVFPASHRAGSTTGALPMGARLRLKASKDISTFPAYLQRLFQAMKTYGLIVADNGSDLYVTGTHDPRWAPYMDAIVSGVRQLRSTDFEVVQLGWQPPDAPTDGDNDGLPDEWERSFGLDPTVATGADGPGGDPDGDGVDNATERTTGTHPRGRVSRLLAEGVRQGTFETRIALANPSGTPAHTQLRFQRDDGVVVQATRHVPAWQRATVDTGTLPDLQGHAFATVVESDVFIGVDRLVQWDAGRGSHAEHGLTGASTEWYFAEGATHAGFQLFYLLQNPSAVPATVTLTYLREAPLAPLVRTHRVPARQRHTVWVNEDERGAQTPPEGVPSSVVITSDVPIVAERAMYRSVPAAYDSGHDSAGAPALETSWFFAEGSTGPLFEQYLLLGNPGSSPVPVRVTYLLPSGPTPPVTYQVPARSRYTVLVNAEHPAPGVSLAATDVSMVVEADAPIVAERAMWWPGGPATWRESHVSLGADRTCSRWIVAEGQADAVTATYVLVANTATTSATVRATLLAEGAAPLTRSLVVGPGARHTIDVAEVFPSARDGRFGMLVEAEGAATSSLVVEWAMYADGHGVHWGAGAAALGSCMPAQN